MERVLALGQDMALLWIRYAPLYLSGVVNTLLLAVAATVLGCLIGLACGLLNTIPIHPQDRLPRRVLLWLLRAVIRIYVEVFRGTPMVLQAVFLYYGLPYFTNNAMRFDNVWAAALLVVSINTGAYMAESVRGGFLSIDPGQTEGAKAIGMTHVQTMLYVIIPQALRILLPQIGNNLIINIKDTSVMFIIGFGELFSVHRGVVGQNYLYFPSAAIEMVAYLTMTLIASIILRWIEKRMAGKRDYVLVKTGSRNAAAGNYNYPVKGSPLDEHSKEHAQHVHQTHQAQIQHDLKYGRNRGER